MVRRRSSTVAGCGPLLINAGQTGYYRTLYHAAAAAGASGRLPAASAGRSVRRAAAISWRCRDAGYQPMGGGPRFLGHVPAERQRQAGRSRRSALGRPLRRLRRDAGDPGGDRERASIALYGPRLQQLGFVPRAGRAGDRCVLRPTLIGTLGKCRRSGGASPRPTGYLQRGSSDPNAIPGSLKRRGRASSRATPTSDLGRASRQGAGDQRRRRTDVALPDARRRAATKRSRAVRSTLRSPRSRERRQRRR